MTKILSNKCESIGEPKILTDNQLVEAGRSGDDNAFRELIKRYESRVAATIIGMLGNCPEADDVGQETFIRFYKNLNKFRGESSVGTYITRIAINLSLNEIKRMKRRSIHLVTKKEEKLNEIPLEDLNNINNKNKELIQWAIGQLKTDFRSALVLRLIDGYSTTETAKILKVPVGTVLSRLARAKKKMMELLLPYKEEIW